MDVDIAGLKAEREAFLQDMLAGEDNWKVLFESKSQCHSQRVAASYVVEVVQLDDRVLVGNAVFVNLITQFGGKVHEVRFSRHHCRIAGEYASSKRLSSRRREKNGKNEKNRTQSLEIYTRSLAAADDTTSFSGSHCCYCLNAPNAAYSRTPNWLRCGSLRNHCLHKKLQLPICCST
jgi:hypothetical protein